MAYLGNDLQVAFPVYRNIDDISGSFNSSLKTFPLTVSGVAPVPAPLYSQQCLISVGGVVQRPDDTGSEGFRLSGGNIIFASAPTTGADFFGVILAGADYINAGGNFPSGTAAVPSITFNDDLDTGIYNSGINQVSITTGGSERLRIDSAGQIESVSLGTAAAPAFSFTTDPNSGIYSPGADQVAISTGGSGRLFVDASGNVGISYSAPSNFAGGDLGATAPVVIGDGTATRNLTLFGANNSYGSVAFADSTTGSAKYAGLIQYYHVDNSLQFYTNSSERLRITSAGLVGVGTSTPGYKLDVNGEVAFSPNTAGKNTFYFTTNASNDASLFLKSDTTNKVNIQANGPSYFNGGNVGVGTTSPASRLHVSAASGSVFTQISSGSNNLYLGYDSVGGIQTMQSDTGIYFSTGASFTERLRIDSSGRVGIGTSSPGQKLVVNGASGSNAIQIENSDDSNRGGRISATGSAASGTFLINSTSSGYGISLGIDGTSALSIDTARRVGVGTTSPSTKLHVAGSGQQILRIQDTGNTSGFDLGNNTTESFISTADNKPITFYTNNLERAKIDSSGRVGIGDSSPGALLSLKDGNTDNISGSKLRMNLGPNPYWEIQANNGGTSATRKLEFFTSSGSGSVLTLLQSGAVGIGTTPDSRLHVSDGSGNALRIGYNPGSNNFNIHDAAQHLFRNNGGASEYGRFDSSGRLLVGTSSARTNVNGYQPLFQVEMAASDDALNRYASFTYGRNNGSGGFGLAFNRHASTTVGGQAVVANDYVLGQLDFNGSDGTNFIPGARISAAVDGTPGTNDMPGRLVFSTTADGASSPTERMRLINSGFLKVSNDGSYQSATSGNHEFTNTLDSDSLVVRSTNASYSGNGILALATRNTTNNSFYAFSYYNSGASAYRFRIADSGNATNTNNSYGAISDAKLKENIVDATSQWSDIKALQVRKYNFKKETGQQTHTQIGLIAQEVELVSPGLVTESPDRDEDGNDLGTVTKSVNYSVLYMKAVKALQEAMERIEQLETEMVAVKAQLS